MLTPFIYKLKLNLFLLIFERPPSWQQVRVIIEENEQHGLIIMMMMMQFNFKTLIKIV